jgi:hypothetical protein
VPIANAIVQLVEHFRGFQGRQRRAAAFHDLLVLYVSTVDVPQDQYARCLQRNARRRVREQTSELTGESASR